MINSNCTFYFKFENQDEISSLSSKKATQQYDTPIKILIKNSGVCSYILYQNFNNSLFSKVFPHILRKLI